MAFKVLGNHFGPKQYNYKQQVKTNYFSIAIFASWPTEDEAS